MEPRWNPDRGGMTATGASSKQIQAVKATTVKGHRQRNATKDYRRHWRTQKTRRRDGDSAVSMTLSL
ncbi:hypothetical protein HN51_031135 [Arachis hypogaea]